MTGLLRSAWDAIRLHLAGARVSETSVRRILLEQAGVAAVVEVRVVRGPTGRWQLLVRIRIAEGCDARDVSRHATEALFRNLPATEIHLVVAARQGGAAFLRLHELPRHVPDGHGETGGSHAAARR